MCKTAVVYADSLLVVNFSMDFLTLYICAKLLHINLKPLRLVTAAVIGALWALMVVLLDALVTVPILQVVLILLSGLCAIVMVMTAYNVHGLASLRAALSYASVNVGLGGIMTALYNFIGRIADTLEVSAVSTSPDVSPIMFCFAAVISGAVSLLYGRFRAKTAARRKVSIVMTAFGKETVLDALCDSGNLLREPFGGKPVIIISAEKLSDVLPRDVIKTAKSPGLMAALPPDFSHKLRLVPTGSVTGGGMLVCFMPERLTLDGRETDAAVAIDTYTSDYDGCSGIVPQILLES
ncbi:MAG: sigma-E processing peptidase SpoIIGA [Clostridia bacterium]|nr:sigma-E processing peptidase SpoIIGA [Clostridia bacterium]